MKSLKVLSSMSALAAATLLFAAQGDLKAKFRAYYDAGSAMMLKKDGAGLKKHVLAYHTPDFVGTGMPGRSGKALTTNLSNSEKSIDLLLRSFRSFSKVSSRIENIVPGKGSAAVTVSQTIIGTTMPDPTGKTHVVVIDGRTLDNWIQVGKAWKIKSAQSLSHKMTLDGKPIGAR